jgi:Arc/MetJ-type ribon-helix-helix transcriptional regulator
MLRDFCRDLYLTHATSRPVAYVKIKTRYLAGDDAGRRVAYGMYLTQLFGAYKRRPSTYVIPYDVAVATLNNETCRKLRGRGNTVTVSFHVTRELKKMLEEVAQRQGVSVSEIVRKAIQWLLETYNGETVKITLTPAVRQALEELVRRGMYRNVEDAIHDAIHQLLQRLNSATGQAEPAPKH